MRKFCVALVVLMVVMAAFCTAAAAEGLDGTQVACSKCLLSSAVGVALGNAAAPTSLLDDDRLEYGPVVSISPMRRGTGGAASWRLWADANRCRAVWLDGGMLRYEQDTDEFLGLSTNVPVGGRDLQENGRIGAGYLFEARDWFAYTRAVVKF